jgi:endonuclease/exonuclease/phosphatase (EEP) superfamily protein YafD
LVVSTHALNFTFLGPYEDQLLDIADRINRHRGPVIWAGDFNTWNGGRWDTLYELASTLGLQAVHFDEDYRMMVLDHVFIRGLKVKAARVLNEWITSDHSPLALQLQL